MILRVWICPRSIACCGNLRFLKFNWKRTYNRKNRKWTRSSGTCTAGILPAVAGVTPPRQPGAARYLERFHGLLQLRGDLLRISSMGEFPRLANANADGPRL